MISRSNGSLFIRHVCRVDFFPRRYALHPLLNEILSHDVTSLVLLLLFLLFTQHSPTVISDENRTSNRVILYRNPLRLLVSPRNLVTAKRRFLSSFEAALVVDKKSASATFAYAHCRRYYLPFPLSLSFLLRFSNKLYLSSQRFGRGSSARVRARA